MRPAHLPVPNSHNELMPVLTGHGLRALVCGSIALAITSCTRPPVDIPTELPVDMQDLEFIGTANQVPQPADVDVVEVSAEEFARMLEANDSNPPSSVLVTADGRMFREREASAPPANLLRALTGGPVAPDIEAPFRPTVPVLLGGDNRERVDSELLDELPFRAIGRIGGCTGALIGPRHVLTAAHCLHDDDGNWYWPLYFRPGVDGTTAINGPARQAVARYAYFGYQQNRSWDIGLIVLEDEPETVALGQLGAWYYNVGTYPGKDVYNFGYPAAWYQCPGQLCGGHMWGMGCHITSSTSGQILHTCDTQPGHSGSPVFETVSGTRRVLAVHWGKPGGEFNAAARLRPAVANHLLGWMSSWPSDQGNGVVLGQ